jgi:RimJ/RimL family protein N-acetyltransferase
MTTDDLPVGPPVAPRETRPPDPGKRYSGRSVTLRPIDAARDVAPLFDGSHGGPEREALWTYMAYGPFADPGAMQAWLETCARSSDPIFLAVLFEGRPAGMASFMNIVPAMRRLEVGHIWYVATAQRTKTNTETIYLMLREAFDALGYRRVEWKCDALNARSRAAARRLGFGFEGIFRNHLIVKGRNRDTAWYAMTDADWPAVKANMERWLYSSESGISLTALNASLVRPQVEDT